MANDEEYLDSLLKSMMEKDEQPRTMETVMNEMNPQEDHGDIEADKFNSNELEEMLNQLESSDTNQELVDSSALESSSDNNQIMIDDLLTMEAESPISYDSESSLSENEEKSLEDDLDTLLANEMNDTQSNVDFEFPEEASADLTIEEEDSGSSDEADTDYDSLELNIPEIDALNNKEPDLNLNNMDVTELIDSMSDNDDDLDEINGLLKKSDNNESIDDDMFALLEGADENKSENPYEEEGEAFDVFNDTEGMEEAEEPQQINKESVKVKKKEKIKRKKDKGNKMPAGNEPSEPEEIALDDSELSELFKEKKQGFFGRLIHALTEEDAPKQSLGDFDENEEILRELDQEDKKKEESKKKKKEEKKFKNNKTKKNTAAPEEGEDGEGEGDDSDNGKKPKKQKKVKEKKEKPPKEKPVKVLTKKKVTVLVLFCITLIAGILALSFFLPDYADRKNAVKAYYESNYGAVYRLMYDKNLDDSDELMFNRSKTILKLQRRIQSYQNYLNMDKPVEALDALLQGINRYPQMTEADTYGVRDEIDTVYDQICSLLQEKYNLSEEEAKEINNYDNETYSLKLNSVIFGTEFIKPGEQAIAQPAVPQDVLPEEEDIINE